MSRAARRASEVSTRYLLSSSMRRIGTCELDVDVTGALAQIHFVPVPYSASVRYDLRIHAGDG